MSFTIQAATGMTLVLTDVQRMPNRSLQVRKFYSADPAQVVETQILFKMFVFVSYQLFYCKF
jgi:hypothetical protein